MVENVKLGLAAAGGLLVLGILGMTLKAEEPVKVKTIEQKLEPRIHRLAPDCHDKYGLCIGSIKTNESYSLAKAYYQETRLNYRA